MPVLCLESKGLPCVLGPLSWRNSFIYSRVGSTPQAEPHTISSSRQWALPDKTLLCGKEGTERSEDSILPDHVWDQTSKSWAFFQSLCAQGSPLVGLFQLIQGSSWISTFLFNSKSLQQPALASQGKPLQRSGRLNPNGSAQCSTEPWEN